MIFTSNMEVARLRQMDLYRSLEKMLNCTGTQDLNATSGDMEPENG